MQDLFSPNVSLANLLHKDGIVNYYGPIMGLADANYYFDQLLTGIDWKNDQATLFDQTITTSRKVAWFGDHAFDYSYANTTKRAKPWVPILLTLKKRVEQECNETFNACLLNLYHDGTEGMAWHSDGEKDLERNGAIASLSFGAERKFAFKHKKSQETISLFLQNGSLLVMKGATQKHWLHRLPPSKLITTPRINLTFRTIETSSML